MRILVVGGAGYVGSHMVKHLVRAGNEVVVLDNLTTGFQSLVGSKNLIVGDLGDPYLVGRLIQENDFDGVMHFAAYSLVGESVNDPAKYYRNNVVQTLNLLDAMIQHKVKAFIFSSTAATFGEPEYVPIDEAHPQVPINPYGASKLVVERVLADYAESYGLNSVSLRYFNACGADPEGELGECHDPETHLIPLILQAATGRRKSISVFGRDYPTHDGTCIRDYIHIEDLCRAHSLALELLVQGEARGAQAFNLGNGNGFSVQEVLDAAVSVIREDGFDLKVEEGERRSGDPAVLVADARRAQLELGWEPEYKELQTIIRHAWEWEKKISGLY